MKIVISYLQNDGKEDGIYPLKRDSNAQNKDQRSIVTACTNTYNRIDIFSTLRTQYCNIKMKLNLYKTGQSGITVTLSTLTTKVSERQHNP
jgi:hypothetical protein